MPNDPYQIGDDNSGITLILSDRGVGVASAHAPSHVGAGADAIREATASQNGLMSAAFATKLNGISALADVTATALPAAVNALPTESTPLDADAFVMWDASATGNPKRCLLSTLGTFLSNTFATKTGVQTLTNKTLSGATITGGTMSGTQFSLADAAITGTLPVNKGGTGLVTYGVGSLLYASASTTLAGLAAAAAGNTLLSGTTPSWGPLPLGTHVSGTLAVTNGGTGVTTSTGTGSVVRATSPSLVTPVLGTPAAGSFLTYCTDLPLSTGVTGVLAVAKGGTGYSTNSYGQISGQVAGTSTTYSSTFTKLGLTTSLGVASGFDSAGGISNKLRYTGSEPRKFLIFASTDIESTTSGANFSIKLFLNGVAVDATECRANAAGKNPYLAKLVTNWIMELVQNDYVELYVASTLGDTGTPQRMRLVATPL